MDENKGGSAHPVKANNSILDKLTPKDLENLAHTPELLDNLPPKVKYALKINS